MNISRYMSAMIGALILVLIVVSLAPEIETAVAGYTEGHAITTALFGIAEWAIPVAAIAGIILLVWRRVSANN